MISAIQNPILLQLSSSGKKNKFGHVLGVVQLIHRLIQADISCAAMAWWFYFPLLVDRGWNEGDDDIGRREGKA